MVPSISGCAMIASLFGSLGYCSSACAILSVQFYYMWLNAISVCDNVSSWFWTITSSLVCLSPSLFPTAQIIVDLPSLYSNHIIMLCRIIQDCIQYTAIFTLFNICICKQSLWSDWKCPFKAINACSTCTHTYQDMFRYIILKI